MNLNMISVSLGPISSDKDIDNLEIRFLSGLFQSQRTPVGTEQFHLPNILFHMAQTTPYVPRPIPGMRLRNLLLTESRNGMLSAKMSIRILSITLPAIIPLVLLLPQNL